MTAASSRARGSGGDHRGSSAADSSTRARSPKCRTRKSPTTPSPRNADSARSTRLSRPTVTGVPYGMRDERHGDDGCCHVGRPRARDRNRISSFENSNIAKGETTPGERALPACIDIVLIHARNVTARHKRRDQRPPRSGRWLGLEILVQPPPLVEHAMHLVPRAADRMRLTLVADHLGRNAVLLERYV